MAALVPPAPAQILYELLVEARLDLAQEMIDQQCRGRRLADLLVTLLEPVLYRIGADLSDDVVGPETEAAAVGFARAAVERWAGRFPRRAPNGRRAMTALPAGEAHDLGLEMLASLLTHDGWQLAREARGSSPDALAARIAESPPDLVCLSVTTPEALPATRDLVAAIHDASPATQVMVGGLAFRLVPERAVRVHADLFAEDARAALETVRATFGRSSAI